MKTIDAIRGSAVAIEPHRTLVEAAGLMEQAGIGALVVLEDGRVIGIVTDRDIVRRAIARRLPLDSRIDAVMTTDVVTAGADDDLDRTMALFRTHAVRRLPVVRDGVFVGMFTIDDALIRVTSELDVLVRPITAELLFAHREPELPVPAPAP